MIMEKTQMLFIDAILSSGLDEAGILEHCLRTLEVEDKDLRR